MYDRISKCHCHDVRTSTHNGATRDTHDELLGKGSTFTLRFRNAEGLDLSPMLIEGQG
jgi:hypothetical protein